MASDHETQRELAELAARLHALVRDAEDGELAGAEGHRRDEEIVELFVVGSPAPLRVTAAVADAVWNTMLVTESTLFVDVALAEGGVARIRPSAVTGFLFRPGMTLPVRAPKRRG